MSFLFPKFLFLLSALSIPILIHLFNFRRYKKIAFTNVHLLRDIEIKSKSIKQLKNYLILACRLLALTFLVFAFAQPILPAAKQLTNNSKSALVIYIDNSFSMVGQNSTNAPLIRVKESVLNVVEELDETRGIYILTNDFKQSELNKLTKSEAIGYINEINSSYYSRNFLEITNRLKVVLEENKNKAVTTYLFSDFQKSQFHDIGMSLDSSLTLSLIRIEGNANENVSIDSCWLSYQGSNLSKIDSLYVKIHNYSDSRLENQPIRMHINNQQVSLNAIDIEPWNGKVIAIPFELNQTGFFSCSVSTVDNGIEADNNLYFSLTRDSIIRIYHLGKSHTERFFNAVYKGTGEYQSDEVKNADIKFMRHANTIIVDGSSNLSSGLTNEIKNKVNEGANLILYPTDSIGKSSINDVLRVFNLESLKTYKSDHLEITTINIASTILKSAIEKIPDNPIYPSTNGHFKLTSKPKLAKEDLLSFENGEAALRKYEINKGNVFLYCFPIEKEYSNLTKHPLFVALSINTAFYKRSGTDLYFTLGKNSLIAFDPGKNTSEVVHVKSNEIDVIPETKKIGNQSFLMLHEQIKKSGNYTLNYNSEQVGTFSMNYSRNESDPRVHTSDELMEIISRHSGQINLYTKPIEEISASSLLGKPSQSLWKYCIILALMFFLTETIIIKFLKA